MSITYQATIDELFTSVKAVFDASTPIIGYVPEVRWPGTPKGPKPDRTKYWARVSQQLVTEGQASLANVNSKKIFESIGLLYIQLFCPRNIAGSLQKGQNLAVALRDAFCQQSTSFDLWYRNAKVVELPETADNYPINIVVEFHFKELKLAA